MDLGQRLRIISWKEYFRDVTYLADKINRDGFKPHVLVAVARGGLVPARILSDLLAVDLIYTITVKAYKGIEKRSTETNILQGLEQKHVYNKIVLVVDDIVDTGETLREVLKHIRSLKPREVRTAVPYVKPWSKIKPDYYVKEVQEWVVFPYEMYETVRELSNPGGLTKVSENKR